MATGYTPPRYEDIRAAVVAQWKLKFGANADTSSDTVDGLFIDILTLFAQQGYDGLAEMYNQHNLGTATGLNVDAIVAPLFRITRLPATKSTSEIWLYGTAGTLIPAMSAISTVDTGSPFETTANVTIAAGTRAVFVLPASSSSVTFNITIGASTTNIISSGTALEIAADAVVMLLANPNVAEAYVAGVQPDGRAIVFVIMNSTWSFSTDYGDAWDATVGFAQAVDTGPVRASYGTLTRIGLPTTGWEGLTNLVDATLGTREETDAAYKLRHAAAVSGRGNATPRSVSQHILALQGVGAVKLYQNTSHVFVDGRPPHSFEFVVDGGDQAEIAKKIWLGHTFGTQSFGTVTVVVNDDQGLVAQPREIHFSRPNYRYIHVGMVITAGEGFPLLPLSDIQTLLGDKIAEWGNSLGIGRDVYIFEIGGIISKNIPGVQSVVIYLASTATPLDSPSFGVVDLPMADLDYSRWSATRIGASVI